MIQQLGGLIVMKEKKVITEAVAELSGLIAVPLC